MRAGWLAAIFIVVLVAGAFGAQVARHHIEITVRSDGSGFVEEEYLIRLFEGDRALFNATLGGAQGIEGWKQFGVEQTLLVSTDSEVIVPQVTQADVAIIIVQYNSPKFLKPLEARGKQQVMGITEEMFAFYDGSHISLPYDPPTELVIRIPEGAELADELSPPPNSMTRQIGSDGRAYNVYVWDYNHPFTAERFKVHILTERSLQSQLSYEAIMAEIQDRFGSPVYIIAVVIVLLLIFWYRHELLLLASEAFGSEPLLEDMED